MRFRRRAVAGPSALVALALLSLGSQLAAAADEPFHTFIPSWQEGAQWTMEAQYRVHDGGAPGPRKQEPTWSDPVRWRFRVMERSRDRNLDVFRVRAEQLSGPGKSVMGYIFLAERAPSGQLRSLALARAAYRKDEHPGEPESIDYTRKATAPYPIINELSLAPGDFPMFEPPETVRSSERMTRYEVTEGSSGMFFAMDVKQTVRRARLDAHDARLKLPLAPAAEILEYAVIRPTDRAGFRQLWTAGAPWCLYSENGRAKAWLLETTKGKDK
ncbi:MAG: hypothetical protein HY303_17200 [Candidatus Wallbacteria bacterium]|nr:hypothetical protein [Candidatus Wallbacteria bacterium]